MNDYKDYSFCSSCGNKIISGNKFCGKCGNAIDEEIVAQQSTDNKAKQSIKNIVANKKILLLICVIAVIIAGVFVIISLGKSNHPENGIYYHTDSYKATDYDKNSWIQLEDGYYQVRGTGQTSISPYVVKKGFVVFYYFGDPYFIGKLVEDNGKKYMRVAEDLYIKVE
jgi:hypothetical protein